MKPFELNVADGVLTGTNPFAEVARAFKVTSEGAAAPTKMVRPPVWENAPAQKLLDWLQCVWTGEAINLRELCRHGPRCFRDKKDLMIELAEVLEGHGWLIPTESRRHDQRQWRIVRKTTKGGWNPSLAQLPPLPPSLVTVP